jgi:hypothetical protein
MPRLHQDESRRAAERPHMSTGESDYAKRVVELSMQLANSRADVENLRMRIKAVDKEHEQLKKDRADMVDRFDAALRRAKAEGIRMVETYARAFVHERAVQLDGFTGSSGMAGVIRGKQSEADRIVDWADARAAQIEEGE